MCAVVRCCVLLYVVYCGCVLFVVVSLCFLLLHVVRCRGCSLFVVRWCVLVCSCGVLFGVSLCVVSRWLSSLCVVCCLLMVLFLVVW